MTFKLKLVIGVTKIVTVAIVNISNNTQSTKMLKALYSLRCHICRSQLQKAASLD